MFGNHALFSRDSNRGCGRVNDKRQSKGYEHKHGFVGFCCAPAINSRFYVDALIMTIKYTRDINGTVGCLIRTGTRKLLGIGATEAAAMASVNRQRRVMGWP